MIQPPKRQEDAHQIQLAKALMITKRSQSAVRRDKTSLEAEMEHAYLSFVVVQVREAREIVLKEIRTRSGIGIILAILSASSLKKMWLLAVLTKNSHSQIKAGRRKAAIYKLVVMPQEFSHSIHKSPHGRLRKTPALSQHSSQRGLQL